MVNSTAPCARPRPGPSPEKRRSVLLIAFFRPLPTAGEVDRNGGERKLRRPPQDRRAVREGGLRVVQARVSNPVGERAAVHPLPAVGERVGSGGCAGAVSRTRVRSARIGVRGRCGGPPFPTFTPPARPPSTPPPPP